MKLTVVDTLQHGVVEFKKFGCGVVKDELNEELKVVKIIPGVVALNFGVSVQFKVEFRHGF